MAYLMKEELQLLRDVEWSIFYDLYWSLSSFVNEKYSHLFAYLRILVDVFGWYISVFYSNFFVRTILHILNCQLKFEIRNRMC